MTSRPLKTVMSNLRRRSMNHPGSASTGVALIGALDVLDSQSSTTLRYLALDQVRSGPCPMDIRDIGGQSPLLLRPVL